MYKDDFKFSPTQVSFIIGLTSIPWVIKPVFGYISDAYPFFSYRRKSYLALLNIIQFIIWLLISFVINNRYLTVFCIFLIQITIAFSNVIGG